MTSREGHLDDIRVVVVAGVIVVHTAITFGAIGSWYLADLDEHLSRAADIVVGLGVIAGGLVGMGLMFLVAGHMTWPALQRHGPRHFARRRAQRLGVPLLVFTVFVSPPLEYLKWVTEGGHGGIAAFARHRSWVGAPGPLWFVEALLAFGLLAAAWAALARPSS